MAKRKAVKKVAAKKAVVAKKKAVVAAAVQAVAAAIAEEVEVSTAVQSVDVHVRAPASEPGEFASRVGRVLINDQRRVGLVTSDCPQWTRMLRIGDDCVVRIAKSTAGELERDGWRPYECELGALKLVDTLARSPLMKTADAAAAIAEVQRTALGEVTLEQAAAEFKRLRNGAAREFKGRGEAIAALKRAATIVNVESSTPAPRASAIAIATTEENDMAAATRKGKTKKTATKSSKAKPARRAAAPAAKGKAKKTTAKKAVGIGALVRDLISKGKGNEEIVDTVLSKFPDARTNSANVSWYRNAMKHEKGGK